jgi:hypothetical protein
VTTRRVILAMLIAAAAGFALYRMRDERPDSPCECLAERTFDGDGVMKCKCVGESMPMRAKP